MVEALLPTFRLSWLIDNYTVLMGLQLDTDYSKAPCFCFTLEAA